MTYKLFTYKSYMYNHLIVRKQMILIRLNCYCYIAKLETI